MGLRFDRFMDSIGSPPRPDIFWVEYENSIEVLLEFVAVSVEYSGPSRLRVPKTRRGADAAIKAVYTALLCGN